MKRILVVESSSKWAAIIKETIERALVGVKNAEDEPYMCSSVEEALPVLTNGETWHLVITDIGMGRNDRPGKKVVAECYRQGIPCVVVSAISETSDVAEFFEEYSLKKFVEKDHFVSKELDLIEFIITTLAEEEAIDVNTLSWIHLSDFHFKQEADLDSETVLEALLVDIKKQITAGLEPDFIAISGDIAYSGCAHEYKQAQEYLDKLVKICGIAKKDIHLVPGNHDVDRKSITKLASAAPSILRSRMDFNRFLTDRDDKELVYKKFLEFDKFKNGYSDKRFIQEPFIEFVKYNKGKTKVGIIGLNSAWLCTGNEDQGKLAIGEHQVKQALTHTKDCDLRIAIAHHPISWLRDEERQAKDLIIRDCDFFLHGHWHHAYSSVTDEQGSKIIKIGAGACYDSRSSGYTNGYNIVKLDVTNRKGAIHYRTYADNQGGFWTEATGVSPSAIYGVYNISY